MSGEVDVIGAIEVDVTTTATMSVEEAFATFAVGPPKECHLEAWYETDKKTGDLLFCMECVGECPKNCYCKFLSYKDKAGNARFYCECTRLKKGEKKPKDQKVCFRFKKAGD